MDNDTQWQKDGWHNNPETLIKIMSKYAEKHDGSGCLDLETIDEVLHIAEHSRITELLKKERNKAIDSVKDMLVVMMEDYENEGLAALENAYRKLESLKGKQQ